MSTTSTYPPTPSLLVADEPPPSPPSPASIGPPEPPKPHHRFKHGLNGTPTHRSWCAMLRRCRNPRNNRYASYGGRGIKVCDRWQGADGFANFVADVGEKPSPKHTLDRIDNAAGYEPSNCRWATQTEQSRNRRSSHVLTAFGVSLTLAEWAERLDIKPRTLSKRVGKLGWTPEEAVSTPPGMKRIPPRPPEPFPRERPAATASTT